MKKEEIRERLATNLSRVENLIEVYSDYTRPGQGRRAVEESDLLRSAVVFLHATLEDFLRSVELWKLPTADPSHLSEIPLAGSPARSPKFSMRELAVHSGKTIDDIVTESVAEYLAVKSYSKTEMIVASLKNLGIHTSGIERRLPVLAELIERRHSIVHQADREERTGSGHHSARSISKPGVEGWVQAVRETAVAVLSQL